MEKKTTEKVVEEKEKFWFEGVPAQRNFKKFAKDIQAVMNRMTNEGYETQIIEREEGILVVGRLVVDPVVAQPQQSQHPLLELIGLQHMSPKTHILAASFLHSIHTQEPKSFAAEVLKLAPTFIQGYSALELMTASEELNKSADEHEKGHEEDSACTLSTNLRAIAKVVKDTAQSQLQ